LTVDIVYDRLAELLAETSKEMDTLAVALAEATKHANHEVAKRPHHSLSSADATTIVAAICIGGEGCGVWCGDSRVYRLTPHGAIQLTHDHSWAEQVVRAGLLSPEEASRDPRAHMITRWLGPPPQDDPGIEIFRFTIQPGDAVMCCTDGLYGYFSPPLADEEADMARMLSGSVEDLNNRIQQLVDIALERGGRDNISLAVLAAGTKSESRRPTAGKSPTPRTVDQTLVLKSGEQAT
jgi:protein phosphatase